VETQLHALETPAEIHTTSAKSTDMRPAVFLQTMHAGRPGALLLTHALQTAALALQVDVREVQMANPADPRFRAFGGRGRRLAD